MLEHFRPTITTTTATTPIPTPSISTSNLFNWSTTTCFLVLACASGVYARLYTYFLSQTGWYLKREAALAMFLPESWPVEDKAEEEESRARVKVMMFGDALVNMSVANATLLLIIGQFDRDGSAYWMLRPATLCLLQSTGILLFAVQLPLQLWLRRVKCVGNYHNFLIAYSVLVPMRAVVASFSVGLMAWSVMDDIWARNCVGGVLVVEESDECRRGLWIRLAPLGVWVIVLAHAAFSKPIPYTLNREYILTRGLQRYQRSTHTQHSRPTATNSAPPSAISTANSVVSRAQRLSPAAAVAARIIRMVKDWIWRLWMMESLCWLWMRGRGRERCW